MEQSGQESHAPEEATPAQSPPTEGKRTQLKVVRENIQILSKDIGNFRRSHDSSLSRLEGDVASLRRDLAAHTRSKELANHAKLQDAANKRLEKQVATLRSDLAALKASAARDAARSRARQEAMLSKILAKVSAKPKAAKSKKKR